MTQPATSRAQGVGQRETSRVEAFSDGVFAIAITLLILEIKVPDLPPGSSGEAFWAAMLALWPSFLAYLVSFAAILVMWVNHHGLFKLIWGIDSRFLYANGCLLLLVTFVPFPTAILAQSLNRDTANAAAVFYCGTYVAINAAFNLLWFTAVRRGLVNADVSEAHVRKLRAAYWVGFVVYTVGTAVAFASALAGLAICSSMWLVWGFLAYDPVKKPGGDATDG